MKILLKQISFSFFFIVAVLSAKSSFALESVGQAHTAGSLISIGQTVWRISDDGFSRQAIDSLEKFYSYRYSFSKVLSANSNDMDLQDKGIMTWGDGVLFNDQGTVYQVSSQSKNPFVSAAVFLGQGFKFSNVKSGNLSSLPIGKVINDSSARHLPGTFLIDSTGTVWIQNLSSATAFSSAESFFAAGGSFTEIVPANVNDGLSVSQPIPLSQNSAYSQQNISTSVGTFKVESATFNLSSNKIRVLTDSATDSDCITGCSVASLNAFVAANNGQSGMNGTYFCPTAYPDCANKTNSFYAKIIDTKRAKDVNANIEYGKDFPFITFNSSGTAKYYSTWSEYKNSGNIAYAGIGYFGLVENGSVSLKTQLLDDKQKNSRLTQGALGLKGQTLYLVHVFGATVPEQASVLQAMGLDYAVLLDGGGSTALMYQGAYKSGPGRDIANAVIVQELP